MAERVPIFRNEYSFLEVKIRMLKERLGVPLQSRLNHVRKYCVKMRIHCAEIALYCIHFLFIPGYSVIDANSFSEQIYSVK